VWRHRATVPGIALQNQRVWDMVGYLLGDFGAHDAFLLTSFGI
jgi:hypothetical protein